MRSRSLRLGLVICILLICAAPVAGKEAPGKLRAFVSILPQKYFVERIGGDLVDVRVLVGPGQSPHTFDPTPRQMTELSRSTVYFRIGIPFEDTLMPKLRATLKGSTVVDTRKGIELRRMDADADHDHHENADEAHHGHDATEHSNNISGDKHDGHTHEAGAPDPHTWLDPMLVKVQAQTICEALCKIDPAHAETYRKNLAAFEHDLDKVDADIQKALAPIKGNKIFVFHPAYGYFADRYGLKQTAVETGGKEPAARQLAALIAKAKQEGVKVIFVQPQLGLKNAQTIATEIGGAVVSLDPLAPDYIRNLEEMAAKVKSALSR